MEILTPLQNAELALKRERNARLAETDWIVTKSLEMGVPVPEVWQQYRQALRDLPANTEIVLNRFDHMTDDCVNWPVKPTE
jgi:hypothetical protein